MSLNDSWDLKILYVVNFFRYIVYYSTPSPKTHQTQTKNSIKIEIYFPKLAKSQLNLWVLIVKFLCCAQNVSSLKDSIVIRIL